MKFGFLAISAGLLGLVAVAACSSSSSSSSSSSPATPVTDPDASMDTDASPVDDAASDAADAGPDVGAPFGQCAATFGTLTQFGFGRFDGSVWAVQKPSDTQCVLPNSDHVVVQVLISGAIYRLVANVQSDDGSPMILSTTLPHALPDPPFQEGWHVGAALDYVTSLGAHSDVGFTALTLDQATAEITNAIKPGDAVSIYATSTSSEPNSAHLIHRNLTNEDGAIVANPMSATPTFLLFHFDEQTF